MGVINFDKPNNTLGVRHLQALMLFLGNVITQSVKVNMSLAIVAMTDTTQDDIFNWSLQTRNTILSSYKWGFIILMIPGGNMARALGGMPIILSCILLKSISSLLLPVAATYGGWQAVCAIRALQGMTAGLQSPANMQLMSKWIPLEEKGKLASFIMSGGQLGIALQLVTSGYIAATWGWAGIFYVDGVIGVIWVIAYLFLGANSPESSKLISIEERAYIQNSLQQVGKQKKLKTPWRSILTSAPVLALMISCIGFNWGFWTLMTQLPTYLNRVLGINIKSNGVISAIPYISLYVLCFPFGYASDYILKKKWVSVMACRKTFISVASFSPALALIGICYAPADTAIVITLLSIGVGLTAGFYCGDALVYLDLSPNFASVLIGVSLFCSNVVALNAPLVSSLLVNDETSPEDWHKVFFLSAGLYVVTNMVFLIFGTSERQKWNEPTADTEAEKVAN